LLPRVLSDNAGSFLWEAGGETTNPSINHHYGVAPRGLVAIRLILGNRAMFDSTGRAYYLTGVGGDDPGGREKIYRLNAGFQVRIVGPHALGINYVASMRDARYPVRAPSHQTTGTVNFVYTFLGDTRFGAVEWRGADQRRSGLSARRPAPLPHDVRHVLRMRFVSDELRTALLVLRGSVALVLIIVCAKVANLMLSRAVAREKEFAIRAARHDREPIVRARVLGRRRSARGSGL
jgi:hypothetical protein